MNLFQKSERKDFAMNGRIKILNSERAFGFISGEDGNDYYFRILSSGGTDLFKRGCPVTFIPDQAEKGLVAKNVQISKEILSRPQFMIFRGTRIRLNNIKSYGIVVGRGEYVYTYKECEKVVTKKTIFGTSEVKKRFLVQDGVVPIYGYLSPRECFVTNYQVKIYNRHTEEYLYIGHKFYVDETGIVHEHKEELSPSDRFWKNEDYLYVTTYQGDNYEWYEDHDRLDVHGKCRELDMYMTK